MFYKGKVHQSHSNKQHPPQNKSKQPQTTINPTHYKCGCLNELNLLLSELSADIQFKDDTCYTLVVSYVQTHLILEPESNACEVLQYIKENFDCIKKDDGYLDNPSPIEGIEDDYNHTQPNPEVEEEEEFDESQRKPIW